MLPIYYMSQRMKLNVSYPNLNHRKAVIFLKILSDLDTIQRCRNDVNQMVINQGVAQKRHFSFPLTGTCIYLHL
jgi:hypothetical protein